MLNLSRTSQRRRCVYSRDPAVKWDYIKIEDTDVEYAAPALLDADKCEMSNGEAPTVFVLRVLNASEAYGIWHRPDAAADKSTHLEVAVLAVVAIEQPGTPPLDGDRVREALENAGDTDLLKAIHDAAHGLSLEGSGSVPFRRAVSELAHAGSGDSQ